jgi:catechol-2,3-dioxygenase
MIIRRIDLLCNDLQQAEQFYCGNFGLRKLLFSENVLEIQAGNSILCFRKVADSKPYYHFAFNIPHNQIKEAVEWLGKKAQIIYTENSAIVDFRNWDAESVYFRDTNENIVEFIARREVDNASDEPFAAGSLHSISEIGIVVENIQDACSLFLENYQLAPFVKQPVKENFAALGDDNGLLILSTEGRHWFPTEIIVKKFPVEIEFENNNVIYNLKL